MPKADPHKELSDAGFSEDQAALLLKLFARKPHTHKMSDVLGLEEEFDEVEKALK